MTSRKAGRKVISPSFVYLLFCEEIGGVIHVKIGKSNHPEKRLTAYGTNCPLPLQSFYVAECSNEHVARDKEIQLLRRLSYLRGRGEWRLLSCGRQVEEVFAAATDVLAAPLQRMKI
jgi:hypothetical protein